MTTLAGRDEAGLRRYYRFAHLEIMLRVFDDADEGLPIPNTADSKAFFEDTIELINRHCEANPELSFHGVMSKVWHDLPKPIETKGMSAQDLERFIHPLEQAPAGEAP